MANKEKHIEFIQRIIRENRLVTDRVNVLRSKGYEIYAYPFGSGGVGQVKEMKSGKIRVQISYGRGRYNYALGVEF